MDKCRICLGNKKNCLSIFMSDNDTQYVEMIRSLTNIKILKDDGITDKICRPCRKGLRDSYEFKRLIERSDAALCDNTKLKKIQFNTISDIKIEIDIDYKPTIIKSEDFKEYFTKGVIEISYNDTVIKKLGSNDGAFGQPVPVLEFLKSIKEEHDDDSCGDNFEADDYGVDDYGSDADDEDNDYVPSDNYLKDKKTKTKYKKITTNKKDKSETETIKIKPKMDRGTVTNVNIKPVYLKDLKLVYSKPSKNRTKDAKQKYHAKLEMCPHCGLMTRTLKSHLLQHTGERSFKCDVCGKGFVTSARLTQHRKLHTNRRDFKCDHCTGSFTTKASILTHIKNRHSTERNYICDICSKAFKRKYALRRHRLTHNSSSSKNVMCDQCNMSFYNKVGLRHHMRVHTGERPYKCEICSQPYSYKHDFNRHCFKKHGVFLKRRSVYVMNEKVLKQEKILMRDLMLRVHGILKDDKPLNPFDGPQAALAFEQAVKALESNQIPIEYQI